jgi:DNA mismatch repair ATPase MutS
MDTTLSPTGQKNFDQTQSINNGLLDVANQGLNSVKANLSNPTFNEEWLNKEYEMTSTMLFESHYFLIDVFRKQLQQTRDVEKLCRQLVLKKIYPSSIYHLYKTIQIVQQMNTCLYESPHITNYLCSDFLEETEEKLGFDYIQNKSAEILLYLEVCFYMEKCKEVNSMTYFEENIFKSDISKELDTVLSRYKKCETHFLMIHNYLNDIMQKKEGNYETEYVKIHETEKSGSSLQITTKRSVVLKQALQELEKTCSNGIISLDDDLKIPLNINRSITSWLTSH